MVRTVLVLLATLVGLLGLTSPVVTTRALNVQLRDRLLDRVDLADTSGPVFAAGQPLRNPGLVTCFYERRFFRPAWSRDGVPTWAADHLPDLLRWTGEQAIPVREADLSHLENLLALARRSPENTALLLELDLYLTDACFSAAKALGSGTVDPRALGTGSSVPLSTLRLTGALEGGLASDTLAASLASFVPARSEYETLRRAWTALRLAGMRGGWPRVPEGPTLKVGDRNGRVRQLRRRLAASNDLDADTTGSLFDAPLRAAVKAFQCHHGLRATGRVDEPTRDILNLPPGAWADRIAVNLERLRWLPETLGERHLLVNVAAGSLFAFDHGRRALAMEVMVGKVDHPTRTFSDTMTYLVLNPSWEIPSSIVVERLLPEYLQDSSFFRDRGITVRNGWRPGSGEVDPETVNWKRYTVRNIPYRFRRKPGRLNPLGRVKFMFPNAYHIYLHDTPSRYLFARNRHTYSSGCVRVHDPIDLATWLLRDDPSWSRRAILAAIRTGKEQPVHLPHGVPVHIVYRTAWVDGTGEVVFGPDPYGWDRPLMQALGMGVDGGMAARSDGG